MFISSLIISRIRFVQLQVFQCIQLQVAREFY